ncbi:MAG: hypothetical protein NDI69_02025 [Bacteriovoracaceae bacterium]|nr:hypothetical protein [Bacteriovoracaceae bacterium]
MKKFFTGLLLALSFTAIAENESIVYPSVYNYGYNVQVQVWNTTDRNVTCSGYVNMRTEQGHTNSEYYYDWISPRFTSYRSYYPRRANDRIISVSHSIFCH